MMQENKIIRANDWCEDTSFLIKKWDRICLQRKHMHNKAANTYDLKNKFLSIPIIFISTILGSLSFISSAGNSTSTSSRMLESRDLQSAPPACVCFSYLNGASSSDSDLCMKGIECYPPNAGDGLCPGDMTACVNIFASDAPTDIPTEAPTDHCVWESYDEDDISTEYPYCDQSIVRHEDDVFRSSLASVEARFCDRTVDFVTNTGYYQFPIPTTITSQDSLEAWCLEHDEGYGVFYQQYNVDGTNMCCVLTGDADTAIRHGHALGGVCVPAGHFDSPSKIYIQRCGSLSRELCAWDEGDAENVGKYPDCPGAMINVNADTQESSKYYFKTLSQCKSLCESANDCNVVSRYSGKEDGEPWHCYFYNCPTFSDLIWVDQTNWGNGADGAQAYLLRCPDPPPPELLEPGDGNCEQLCGGLDGACPDIGTGDGGMGFWDCGCCYQYWVGCSFHFCSDWCYPDCTSSSVSSTPSPTKYPTNAPTTGSPTPQPTHLPTTPPTRLPTAPPTRLPTTPPTRLPTAPPTRLPTAPPTRLPTAHPTPSNPTRHPTPAPTQACPPTVSSSNNDYDDDEKSVYSIFPYIIGAFNMFVAILSALHSFLKYDALEDRHRQYSRHFGALQLDLEALMAKPASQRGDPGTMLERYKTKYAVLINNAPALPEHMERICCISDSDPTQISTIELTTI